MPVVPIADEITGYAMLYSSGTTGRPKGVKRPFLGEELGTMNPLGEVLCRRICGIDTDAAYLSPAPLYHAAPLGFANFAATVGATTIIMERFDTEDFLRFVELYRATHTQVVPTMFVRLLKLPVAVRQRYDVFSLKVAVHVAAPCPVDVKRQMIDWWGPILVEYYGGTEGNGFTACDSREWLAHPGTVGRSLGGALKIVGEDGAEVPPGTVGQVYFAGGPNFSYHNDPAKTAAAYHPQGWSSLGDVGYVDADNAATGTYTATDGAGNDAAGGSSDGAADTTASGPSDRTAALVGSLGAAAARATSPLLGDISAGMLAALAQLAARMAGPAALLGTLFIPTNRSPVTDGVFADQSGLGYSYDRDTGVLRITELDAAGNRAVLAEGHIDLNGVFRDGSGNAIGRVLPGGAVIVDPETLPGYLSRPAVATEAGTGAAVQTGAEIDNEPKLCPDPSLDHPGARSKDIEYQQYVSTLVNGRPLPYGLAVSLWNPVTQKWVAFDDCRLSDGTMIDAKGTGYADMLRHNPEGYPWKGIEEGFIDQADRQRQAAQGRPIEWHFDEPEVADQVRGVFDYKGFRITVIYTPWRR
jgi:hypothetical protein